MSHGEGLKLRQPKSSEATSQLAVARRASRTAESTHALRKEKVWNFTGYDRVTPTVQSGVSPTRSGG